MHGHLQLRPHQYCFVFARCSIHLPCTCRGASKPDRILSDDPASFLKNDCAADKWVAIELPARMRVTAIELLMMELYSSRVKDFDVYGATARPLQAALTVEAAAAGAPPWERLGSFRAENRKGAQVWAVAHLCDRHGRALRCIACA